jgi:glutamate racemase
VILPGAAAAVAATKSKRVGVIGTVGTIASNAYTNAIRHLDTSIEVVGQACPLFVPLAEEGWINHQATALVAKEYLFPLKLQKIDTLVLGCTHYPLLKEVIGQTMSAQTQLIDSGEATASEVERILDKEGLRNTRKEKANVQFFVSDIPRKFTEVGEMFLGQKLGRVRKAEGFL